MTTRVCKNNMDRDSAIKLIQSYNLPLTINIKKGADRSVEQNKLLFLWLNEAAEQLQDETVEQKRGYCKLHFAVPLLRAEDEEFREVYDEVIRPLSYEQKLKTMMIPIDLPVSRRMKSGQMKRYLDDIYDHFTGLGVKLTDPEE